MFPGRKDGSIMNENFEQQKFTTEQTAPKKKGRVRTAIALAAAVAIVGGASGFGGAYLASSMNSAPATEQSRQYAEADKTLPDDVSNAIKAIYASSGATEELSAQQIPAGANGQYTAEELYETVNDTIVLINIYASLTGSSSNFYNRFFGYDELPEKESEPELVGYGSGIVFSEDGYILTNAHVVDEAEKLEVVVNDYNDSGLTHTYEARVIGSDANTDVAIIKIDRPEAFKAASIGDSDTLRVGQDVCAIGNPGVSGEVMFTHTMTKGVISGLQRVNISTGYNTSYIQTDTAINGGNSGGALFDMYGNVVGIVNQKIVSQNIENIGFAITINEAKPIMEDLLAYGYVKSRPVLGITTAELNGYTAQMYGTKLSKGLLVVAIRDDASAKNSGLCVNDIITKINGTNVEKVTDVQAIIKNMKAGDTITATVARETEGGKLDSVDIEIVLSESAE